MLTPSDENTDAPITGRTGSTSTNPSLHTSANISGNTASCFAIGTHVLLTKTGEKGVIVGPDVDGPGGPCAQVIFAGDPWGDVWRIPTRKLEEIT
jgi:hypothetical protein